MDSLYSAQASGFLQYEDRKKESRAKMWEMRAESIDAVALPGFFLGFTWFIFNLYSKDEKDLVAINDTSADELSSSISSGGGAFFTTWSQFYFILAALSPVALSFVVILLVHCYILKNPNLQPPVLNLNGVTDTTRKAYKKGEETFKAVAQTVAGERRFKFPEGRYSRYTGSKAVSAEEDRRGDGTLQLSYEHRLRSSPANPTLPESGAPHAPHGEPLAPPADPSLMESGEGVPQDSGGFQNQVEDYMYSESEIEQD